MMGDEKAGEERIEQRRRVSWIMEQMKIGRGEDTRDEGRMTGEMKVIHPLCSPAPLARYLHSHPHTHTHSHV